MARRTPSAREGQVIELMAAGKSAEDVATELGIGRATVDTHRYRAARRQGELVRLSPRQQQVVSCVALGLTIDEVAAHLGIARGTASNHRTLASLTLGLGSVVGLTHYAIVRGWVEAGDALTPQRIDEALRKIAHRPERRRGVTRGRARPRHRAGTEGERHNRLETLPHACNSKRWDR